MIENPNELRPGLHGWMTRNGKKPKEAAEALDCAYQTVRRICLPFGHPDRRTPDEPLLKRIVCWTDGEVGAPDFYPPSLGGREPEGLPEDLIAEPVQ